MSSSSPSFGVLLACSVAFAAGCVLVPNPNHDGVADDSGTGSTATETGTGDGDPTTTGDGDPHHPPATATPPPPATVTATTGDGDPTGDGDGDPMCNEGEEGCDCTPLETCDDGLACVLELCIPADACVPVDDNVAVSASPTYIGGDPPPPPPDMPASFICSLNGVDNGNSVTLNLGCGGMDLLQSLVVTVQPKVSPIEDLVGNLAATVTIVELPEGRFVKIDANGMQLYYVNGTALSAMGVTDYPWSIAPYSSACGTTPSMCGQNERLAMFVDGGTVFDGNAGQPSGSATAWIEKNLDVCGTIEYEFAVLAH